MDKVNLAAVRYLYAFGAKQPYLKLPVRAPQGYAAVRPDDAVPRKPAGPREGVQNPDDLPRPVNEAGCPRQVAVSRYPACGDRFYRLNDAFSPRCHLILSGSLLLFAEYLTGRERKLPGKNQAETTFDGSPAAAGRKLSAGKGCFPGK